MIRRGNEKLISRTQGAVKLHLDQAGKPISMIPLGQHAMIAKYSFDDRLADGEFGLVTAFPRLRPSTGSEKVEKFYSPCVHITLRVSSRPSGEIMQGIHTAPRIYDSDAQLASSVGVMDSCVPYTY